MAQWAANVTEVFRVHEHCLHVLKSKYHRLGEQQRIEADVLYTVNSFVFDIVREMLTITEFLPEEGPLGTFGAVAERPRGARLGPLHGDFVARHPPGIGGGSALHRDAFP